MSQSQKIPTTKATVELLVKIGALFLLLIYCFNLLSPFLLPFLWAIIIAVALNPVHLKIQQKTGASRVFSATVLIILILSGIFLPAGLFVSSFTESVLFFKAQIESGKIPLNEPNETIRNWPLIGKPLYQFLHGLSGSLLMILSKYKEEILTFSKTVLIAIIGGGLGFIKVIFSIILSGVLLAAKGTGSLSEKIFNKIAGEHGDEFLSLTTSTIRSVVKGVLGVAVIQTILAGIGFYLSGIPHAGIWTAVTLFFCIVQVGPSLVIIPAMIYLFSLGNNVYATAWTVYMVIVIFSDNILKPVLLGKGAKVPTMIIFLGVIGGFLISGFIGLFTGAIVLSIGYKLFLVWLKEPEYPENLVE